VYPSEQQYYNAIKKKGWQNIEASTIPSVLAVHNLVNEKSWQKVLAHESLVGHDVANDDNASQSTAQSTAQPPPRLVRFLGRPTTMSPKAYVNTYLLGYTKPFDRHDWVIERSRPVYPHERIIGAVKGENVGEWVREETRFIIDFYNGTSSTNGNRVDAPGIYLDVRPAVDSVTNFMERIVAFGRS
jgi:cytochrome c heme-lyase